MGRKALTGGGLFVSLKLTYMENKKEKFYTLFAIIMTIPVVILVITSFFVPVIYWGWQLLKMPVWFLVVAILILYIIGKLIEKYGRR